MKKDYVTKCQTQRSNLTTNHKVKVGLFSPEFIATKQLTWVCHVDNSAEIRYDMITGRYLLTALGFNFKNPKNAIKGGNVNFEICTASMVNLGMYKFKI